MILNGTDPAASPLGRLLDVPGGLAVKAIVERNLLREAPMEPFWITTVRFVGQVTICAVILVILVVAL